MIDDQWLAGQLRTAGLIDEAQLRTALAKGEEDLCTRLIRCGLEESKLLQFLGVLFGTRYITTEKLGQALIPQWILDLVPAELCEDLLIVPVRCDRQRMVLSVVTTDPGDTNALESVQRAAGVREVQAHVALLSAVEAALRKWYKGDIHAFARLQGLEPQYSDILETYDQRLIDFEAHVATPTGQTTRQPPESTLPRGGTMRFASPSSLAPIEAPLEEDFGMGIATALVQLLELDQGWRRGHSIAVARLAALAAQHLDFSADEALALRLAALFHELGKPADPHLTLFSIDASPRARALAEQVHLLPVRLLARAATPPAVAMVLAAMYERPTGTGIPGRLSGDQVPRGAMVLAVLDAYVDRVDRVKAAPDKALAEVQISAAPLLAPQDMLALSTALSGDQQKRSVPLNVLIVDGDLDAAQALELDLLVKGFNVRVCTTTADAARAMITDGSDLVVTEVQLAPVDGFDFVQRLRADSRTRDVPVIFLTHRADPDDASHGRELGAVGYLVKPYSPEQLLETIERAFSSAPAPP